MRWDLEERVEDALVSYLRQQVPGTMRVSAAWERDNPEYPGVVVHAGESAPISEPAAWHDARMVSVEVAVMTEATDDVDSSGTVISTVRERNVVARSAVMDALFVSDLNAQLIAQGIEWLALSMAQFDRMERAVDGQVLVTTLYGTVIAEPVTGA